MTMFVYFARPIGLHGPVKIGCSAAPLERLKTLMTWSPIPLEIAATVPGDGKLERRIHGLFAKSHSHHEWFHASAELSQLIFSLAAGKPVAELIDIGAPIIRFRARKKHVYTEEWRRRASYKHRLRRAFRGPEHLYAPRDVYDLMTRWDGSPWRGQKSITPTPAEFQRLDEVLANPQKHGITREQRFPHDEFEEAA